MLRSLLSTLLATALLGCAQPSVSSPLAPLERSLVFHPVRYPHGDWAPRDLTFEDVWFKSADGTQLHGWYLPHDQPRAVALWLHGNAGNVAMLAPELKALHDQHELAVFAFDYRGYGRSDGRPSEAGILADARAARAWLAQEAGVQESDIVLFGRSLGGGVAVDLAANDGARGLVLISTFTSLPDVGATLLPLAPTRLLMSNRLDSLAKISRYQGPLLQSHGDADKLVPFRLGRRLFAAASEPKHFVAIAGGGHMHAWTPEYHAALDDFVKTLPATAVGSAADEKSTATNSIHDR